jgi:hypothetical protein
VGVGARRSPPVEPFLEGERPSGDVLERRDLFLEFFDGCGTSDCPKLQIQYDPLAWTASVTLIISVQKLRVAEPSSTCNQLVGPDAGDVKAVA